MINPSTFGWIQKYLDEYFKFNYTLKTELELYKALRKSGFIYGHTVELIFVPDFDTNELSDDEKTKLAYLNAMSVIYHLNKSGNQSQKDFIDQLHHFYHLFIKKRGITFFTWLPKTSKESQLEKIIDSRLQINQNDVIKKLYQNLTNSLLFLDVLAFKNYLNNQFKFSDRYFKIYEENCQGLISYALTHKTNQSHYETMIINLFQQSLRYSNKQKDHLDSLEELNTEVLSCKIEKLFLLDILQLALWSDEVLEPCEKEILRSLISSLNLTNLDLTQSTKTISSFINNYHDLLPFLKKSNPVKSLYNQTNKTVAKLIKRNKKRLTKELLESKELIKLLKESRKKELSPNEKKLIKKQLLDICKSIPSLAIFLLPGGGILLPLLIRYIPEMLPSAFNENLERSKKN